MYKILDKIVIITQGKYYDGVTAFVFEEGNKSQEQTAIKWAGDEFDKFVYNNEGFRAEIKEAADRSSVGGKLSFWMIEISKDNKRFRVGINSDLLLKCVKTTELKYGKFVGDMAFIKDENKLGLADMSSQLWLDANKDADKRELLKKRKTSKPSLGYRHESVKNSNALICELYDWYGRTNGEEYAKPYVCYLYLDTRVFSEWEGMKLSECLKDRKFIEKIAKELEEYYPSAHYLYDSITAAIPCRAEGELFIEVDIDPTKISLKLDEAREEAYQKFMKSSSSNIPNILRMSFSAKEKPDIKDLVEIAKKREEDRIRRQELARLGVKY